MDFIFFSNSVRGGKTATDCVAGSLSQAVSPSVFFPFSFNAWKYYPVHTWWCPLPLLIFRVLRALLCVLKELSSFQSKCV